MTEDQAFEKLQKILSLAEELNDSGKYCADEIINEIRNRIGE